MADLYAYNNNLRLVLESVLSETATQISFSSSYEAVVEGDRAFTIPGGTGARITLATLSDGEGNSEIVRVTLRQSWAGGNVMSLNIVRAQEGTDPREWPAGTALEFRITAGMLSSFVPGDRPALTSLSVGPGAVAQGNSSIALGPETVAPPRSVVVGNASIPAARTPENVRFIQPNKRLAVSYTANYPGYDYVDLFDWNNPGVADEWDTWAQSSREMTLYSIPVQMGDRGWQASHTYKHGDTIAPGNGRSYVAYVWAGDYYSSGSSGASEPSWNTTVGSSTGDNNVDWLCVDPANVPMVLPDYVRFTPTSVGVIARTCVPGSTPTQPSISFGVSGDLDKWLGSTPLTKMTGFGASQFFDPSNTESAKSFGAARASAGVDIDLSAVFVVRGYAVENLDP